MPPNNLWFNIQPLLLFLYQNMKFLHAVILSLSLLLLVPLLVVESSSSSSDNNSVVSNITRGSSLSSNDTSPYWLSPSGNIAFGFYWLPCTCSSPNCRDRYVVGIWFVKYPLKTMVWSANPNDLPLHKPSSLLFTKDGKLMLRIMPGNKEKPLVPGLQEPVSYAMMHDDGNFVLYGADSQIVWESFDYPTDTILGGQKLRAGIDLISGNYKFSVRPTDGLVAIYYGNRRIFKVLSDEIGGSVSAPVTLNFDTTGNLYLVDSDDVVLQYLYRNEIQQHEEGSTVKDEKVRIYIATLDSGAAVFNPYEERIGGYISSTDHGEKSSPNLVLLCSIHEVDHSLETFFDLLFVFLICLIFFGSIFCCVILWHRCEMLRRLLTVL